MVRMAKHLILFGLSLPAAVAGYHLALAQGGPEVELASRRLVDAAGLFGVGAHHLPDLELFRRCMYYVGQRYVEKDRLDPDSMFQGSLDQLERETNEVLFQREPGSQRLHVSVGAHSTSLQLPRLTSLESLEAALLEVAAVLDEHLAADSDRQAVEYALINGALSTLDPHSLLLPPQAARDMEIDNQGEFGGLGITISTEEGLLTITEPMKGTPAHEAGLRAGDQILRIEDESTINMDLSDAVERLRGPVGSPVNLLVGRASFDTPRPFSVVRDTIRLNHVEGVLLEGDVGYIEIAQFHKHVSSDLDEQLARLRREAADGLQGLVLDLRGNPGGYLNQAYEVSNKFLSEGVVVSTVEGDSRRRDEQRATRPGTEPAYPIAVLVDGNSASASEIVAGALRNQQRAVIIGERTFGKGSVQHLYDNRDDTKLKLTVAKYLTPGDHSIQGVGIPPDILLKPTFVRAGEDGRPWRSFYARESLEREASLDHHLGSERTQDSEAVFSVRYLVPEREDEDRGPQQDWQVGFAREVLVTGRTSRRADLLQAAGPAIARRAEQEADRIEAALRAQGIDWGEPSAPDPAQVDLSVGLDLGGDGVLVAGQSQPVTLVVTNKGEEPLYRVSAVTRSDNPWLDRLEFVIGTLAPGETLRDEQPVVLHPGYRSELSPVEIQIRGAEEQPLMEVERTVETMGEALPQLAHRVRWVDDGSLGSEGDGDGVPETGERIALQVEVKNVGEGATRAAFVRVKNKAGRALDLVEGSALLGAPTDRDGAPCDLDASADAGDATGCRRALNPGQTESAVMLFDLRGPPEAGEDGWQLELRVGDNERYDFAAVRKGGFHDYFQTTQRLTLDGTPYDDSAWSEPPVIEVTRGPGLLAETPGLVLSGIVHAPGGVRDVMVFHGDEKIFFRGGRGGAQAVPFSAETALDPGSNLIMVLVRDETGRTSTWSQHVTYAGAAVTAQAAEPALLRME